MTVKGNTSTHPGVKNVKMDPTIQMWAYDQLPKRWKELVGSLPIPQSTEKVLEYYNQKGEVEGYNLIVSVMKKAFPGWVPPIYYETVPIIPGKRRDMSPRNMRMKVPVVDE